MTSKAQTCCWQISPTRQKKSSGIEAMTATGSGYRLQNAISPPVFRRRRTGNQSRLTTGICIKSVTSSKICSQSSKTGGVSQHDTTAALTHSVSNPYRSKFHLLSQRMSIRLGQVWRGSHNLSLRNRTFARMTRRRMRAVRATFACFPLSVRLR